MRPLYLLIPFFCLTACRDTKNKENQPGADTTSFHSATDSNTVTRVEQKENISWISDFKKFRSAIVENDIKGTSAYFHLPMNVDSSDIWLAIEPDSSEVDAWKSKAQDSLYFNYGDFKNFYSRIITKDLKMGISKIKSEELFSKGASSSGEFTNVDRPFQLYADYDQKTNSLILNVSYLGGKDEEGNYVSEGEYSIIYIFKVIENKIQFDRITAAG